MCLLVFSGQTHGRAQASAYLVQAGIVSLLFGEHNINKMKTYTPSLRKLPSHNPFPEHRPNFQAQNKSGSCLSFILYELCACMCARVCVTLSAGFLRMEGVDD